MNILWKGIIPIIHIFAYKTMKVKICKIYSKTQNTRSGIPKIKVSKVNLATLGQSSSI